MTLPLPLKMHSPVKITNPAGGVGWTNRKRAKSYVRRGRASWLDDHTIQFIHQTIDSVVITSARLSEFEYDRAAHNGIASRDAIKHLPVAGPVDRLLTRRSAA